MPLACASPQRGGPSDKSGLTAIYSPPVRLGGQGRVLFLPAPSKVATAEERSSSALTERSFASGETPPFIQEPCLDPFLFIAFFKEGTANSYDSFDEYIDEIAKYTVGKCAYTDLLLEAHRLPTEDPKLPRKRAEVFKRYLERRNHNLKIIIVDKAALEPRVPYTDPRSSIQNPRVVVGRQPYPDGPVT